MRKFRHKNGFNDGTDYLEAEESGGYIVRKNGSRTYKYYWCISECLRAVKEGIFIEITEGTMNKEQINAEISKTQETIRLAQKQLETLKEELNKTPRITGFEIGDVFVGGSMSKVIIAPTNFRLSNQRSEKRYALLGCGGLNCFSNFKDGATEGEILQMLNSYKDIRKIGNANEAMSAYLRSIN